MKKTLSILAAAFAAQSALGAIYITEIMYNPKDSVSMPDATHEFVEIYNAGGSSVDIQNWTIDDGGAPVTITASSFVLAPGAFLVIGNTSVGTFNSSYNVSLTGSNYINLAGSLPSLDNTGPEIVNIEDGGALSQASVSYQDGAGGWPVGVEGSSISLKHYVGYVGPTTYQTGTNWETHGTAGGDKLTRATFNAGGYASPGYQLPIPEPTSLGLIAFGAILLRKVRAAK